MKKIFIIIILFISIIPLQSFAYVSVKGYYKSNGTYVAPYVRSNPNGLKYDNYGYKSSQGLYNQTYGTKGATWDTPTYVTDPDYYVGKSLYNSGSSNTVNYTSDYYPSYVAPLPTKNVSYVVKLWVDNNSNTDCSNSSFLRLKERQECASYKLNKSSYTWNITTAEFDGLHYVYDKVTNTSHSCKDGYHMTTFDSAVNGCSIDVAPVICPIGYTCTVEN